MSAPGSTKWYRKTFQDYSSLKSEVFENSDSENIVPFYLSWTSGLYYSGPSNSPVRARKPLLKNNTKPTVFI